MRPGQTGGKSGTDILVQGCRYLKAGKARGMRIEVQMRPKKPEAKPPLPRQVLSIRRINSGSVARQSPLSTSPGFGAVGGRPREREIPGGPEVRLI